MHAYGINVRAPDYFLLPFQNERRCSMKRAKKDKLTFQLVLKCCIHAICAEQESRGVCVCLRKDAISGAWLFNFGLCIGRSNSINKNAKLNSIREEIPSSPATILCNNDCYFYLSRFIKSLLNYARFVHLEHINGLHLPFGCALKMEGNHKRTLTSSICTSNIGICLYDHSKWTPSPNDLYYLEEKFVYIRVMFYMVLYLAIRDEWLFG